MEQTRPVRRREELWRRRPLRAARRNRLLRGRPARSAERADRQSRQGAEDAERDGGVLRAVLHPQAGRHGARQPQDLLRRQQPRQQARVRVADDPAAWREQQQSGRRRPISATASSCGSATPTWTRAGRETWPPATTGSCRICRWPLEPDGRPIVAKIRVEFADVDGFTRPLEGNADHVRACPTRPPTWTRRTRR